MSFDPAAAAEVVERTWDTEIVPALHDYIRIPNVSPEYDADWATAGHMDAAVELVRAWLAGRDLPGATVEVVRLDGRTPVVLVEVPPSDAGATTDATPDPDTADTVLRPPTPPPTLKDVGSADTVLLYGHLDKQPPMERWRDGLAPFGPVLEGDRLYGRGGADDGYAAFASITAIEAVRAAGGRHARCVVLIEASEESGSPDLPAYVDHLADRIGTPSLVVCLDSWAPDDRRLWLTTSLRGLVQARLRVDVLTAGIHSGQAGGLVPSSFRVLRHLLDRIEDPATGRVTLPALHVDVPAERRAQAEAAVAAGVDVRDEPPWTVGPVDVDPVAALLATTWEPTIATTGIGGAPPPEAAGNVLRAHTEVMLAVRIPPGVDAEDAADALTVALTSDPPDGARVSVTVGSAEDGWAAPPTAPWLAAAVDDGSEAAFGAPAAAVGVGGSIPFMAMLGERFPDAQFVITGVLVPGSNAHGPDEFLHIPTGKRVTTAIAAVLAAHATR